MRDEGEVRDFLSAVQDRRKQRLNENRQVVIREAQHSDEKDEKQVQSKREFQKEIRADEFLRRIKKPRIVVPDPVEDFYMYERMDEAMEGLHEQLDRLRRNYGAVGYTAQNRMSDLSKAYIDESQVGDEESEEEMAFLDDSMEQLALGFNEASANGEIAETGNRFSKTIWQERLEADLFGKIWPVIIGKSDQVPHIISWKNFRGNIQAYLYGFLDVVSELAKALTEELSEEGITADDEFELFKRYLAVASSIVLRLSRERHVPGYIINNGYGPWIAYTRKLRTAEGTIAHVRREYNLRLSMERMIQKTLNK